MSEGPIDGLGAGIRLPAIATHALALPRQRCQGASRSEARCPGGDPRRDPCLCRRERRRVGRDVLERGRRAAVRMLALGGRRYADRGADLPARRRGGRAALARPQLRGRHRGAPRGRSSVPVPSGSRSSRPMPAASRRRLGGRAGRHRPARGSRRPYRRSENYGMLLQHIATAQEDERRRIADEIQTVLYDT